MDIDKQIKLYKPVNRTGVGLFKLILVMSKELIKARELTWRLFLRDFKAKYKQSLLGWVWIFILPAVAVGTFFLLNQSGAIKIENIPVPYPIYGLVGISLWQIFAGGLNNATNSLVSAGSFIVKINFSRESLIIAAVGQTIVEFLIRIILLIGIYIFYGLYPNLWIILLPLLILPLILLTLGLGFLTSLLNAVFRDIQSFITIVLGFFLFLMPVMYTMPEKGLIFEINKYNPIYFLIIFPRDLIISGSSIYLNEFIFSTITAVLIFLSGWVVFNKSQSKIAEVV